MQVAICQRTTQQLPADVPCSTDFGSCVSGVAPVFLQAGGNINALAGCNKNDLSERIAARIQCVGTKPSAAQLRSQLAG